MQQNWRKLTEDESGVAAIAGQPPYGTYAPNALQRALIALARATILRRGAFRAPLTRLILALGV